MPKVRGQDATHWRRRVLDMKILAYIYLFDILQKAGLSYRKVNEAYKIEKGEKLTCMIALGYGESQGVSHKIKTMEQVSNATSNSPSWFRKGVEAALLAPTAINQQKFSFFLQDQEGTKAGCKPKVLAKKGFSMVGYTKMDLGIAKLHFEIGAGKENFKWVVKEG